MSEEIVLGTRGSALALAQANTIHGLLAERGIEARIQIVSTRGDRELDQAFHKMEGKGFFTVELEEGLAAGRLDLVVHSLKDLPTEQPEGLELVAVLQAVDPADMLVSRGGEDLAGLPKGAKVGTSSLRRAAQLLAVRPDLELVPIRGNVPTRVAKVDRGEVDAAVLAAAGIARLEATGDLGEHSCTMHRFDPKEFLPCPGQGVLGLQGRRDHPRIDELRGFDQADTRARINAERELLAALGGGCSLPLGCRAELVDEGLVLEACLGEIDDDGKLVSLRRAKARGTHDEVIESCRRQLLGEKA